MRALGIIALLFASAARADPPACTGACVGPVPAEALAEILKARAYKPHHGDRPLVPFEMVIGQLKDPITPQPVPPDGKWTKICVWGGGKLDLQTVRGGSTQKVTIPDLVALGPFWDVDTYMATAHLEVPADGRPKRTQVDRERRIFWGPPRTYLIGLVCAFADRAAIYVDFTDGPLNAEGHLVVLLHESGTWRIESDQLVTVS